jgi:hypothetical protein
VEREGNRKGYRKGFVCCNVVMSAGVTGLGAGGKWVGLKKGGFYML